MRALVFIGLLLSCGGKPAVGPQGHSVGAACATDRDCEKRCVFEDDFGGASGYCTLGCATDQECPAGTACITTQGGICAVTCNTNADCAGFGRAFVCKSKTRQSGGPVNVCRLP